MTTHTQSNSEQTLLPCPFCGGKAILGMFNVWCSNCEAQTRKTVGVEAAEIINAWNSRISAPTVASKEKLPDDYICIAPQEQALVINRLRGVGSKEDNRQAELHEKLCLRCQELVAECERREVASIVALEVDQQTIYADGYCARCSELAYPLTRALESTGVPTGAKRWQQTYGPNKVRALADLETCLRRLLFALEQCDAKEIEDRIQWASHYIEFHAAVRRRLTALAQQDDAPAPASTVAPVEQSDDTLSQLLTAGRRWRDARTAYMTDNAVTCREYGLAGDALAELISRFDTAAAPLAARQDEPNHE